MKYAIVYIPRTGKYSIHAAGCSAASDNKRKVLLTRQCGEFDSVPAATTWCHADESDKAGHDLKAIVSVCKCTKSQ